MANTIEVWIRYKDVDGGWTLYALPKNLNRANAMVLARRQRDRNHEYEIREIPDTASAETRCDEADNESRPTNP